MTASDDGGPYTVIEPGATWSPDFTVLDSASTMWHHPHLHGKTHEQVNSGLAGMILIRDEVEAASGLPRTYGVDEFPLILQDRSFGVGNTLRVVPLGDVMMVNGTLDPYLEVPGQLVRFRVLNGSNERAYYVGVSENP
ncbi:MAG: multicopper oxidase domain-containing protein [Verrucomicrobia bacterium]|nr:multicopper oxidase domain-containing protein [Verrucomicrobiota bacterium]